MNWLQRKITSYDKRFELAMEELCDEMDIEHGACKVECDRLAEKYDVSSDSLLEDGNFYAINSEAEWEQRYGSDEDYDDDIYGGKGHPERV